MNQMEAFKIDGIQEVDVAAEPGTELSLRLGSEVIPHLDGLLQSLRCVRKTELKREGGAFRLTVRLDPEGPHDLDNAMECLTRIVRSQLSSAAFGKKRWGRDRGESINEKCEAA